MAHAHFVSRTTELTSDGEVVWTMELLADPHFRCTPASAAGVLVALPPDCTYWLCYEVVCKWVPPSQPEPYDDDVPRITARLGYGRPDCLLPVLGSRRDSYVLATSSLSGQCILRPTESTTVRLRLTTPVAGAAVRLHRARDSDDDALSASLLVFVLADRSQL